jgi:aspartyl-tRNA(Asn)/glutamyl-tRNA(Gln) amidotransferase subunit B
MRSKEEAHDYRYFPEPDLAPVMVDNSWLKQIKARIGELPDSKLDRFINQYRLPEHDADLLTSERSAAEWFEQAVELGGEPRIVSNWMKGELMRLLNEENRQIEECRLKPEHLVGLLKLLDKGTISGKIAKTVFEEVYYTGKNAEIIIKEKGLVQISDEAGIDRVVNEVLEKNPGEVERFKAGEEKLLGFFVGQVMKATKGKANPQMVNELLRKRLG